LFDDIEDSLVIPYSLFNVFISMSYTFLFSSPVYICTPKMSTSQTILGITSLCFIFIAFAIFLLICIIIFKSRNEWEDVSLLLICNTCVTVLLTCITLFIMTISNLSTGFLIYNLDFCYAWSLFYDMFECSIYYSYCLQAMYRLCRVVFYKKKSQASYSKFIRFTIGQWLLVVALLLPPIPLKWYNQLPNDKYCLIPYTNVNAEIDHIIVIYVVPLVCISTIYVWIIIFIRYISHTSTVIIAAKQRQRNLRDLAIVKRIAILLAILILLRFPTVIFMVYGIIVGQLYPLTYGIVGLITSVCLIVIGLMTIYMTSPLRKNILIVFICDNSAERIPDRRFKASQTPLAVVGDTFANRQDRLKNTLENTVVGNRF
jgi:hypothetical protein